MFIINQDGKQEIMVRLFLPITFIGEHARKCSNSTMLARFSRLPHGFDLLEGQCPCYG
jgi:hypothetical protein